jgi:general secretion pathway protein A
MDEVHKISDDVLECIRLLNNLEQGSIKLIQMLLLGQEEFLVKLSRPELESFKQRIAWLETLGKMTPAQTHKYIMHRLKVAGSQSRIFTDDAMEALIGATRGTPRLVNTFCDRALRVSYESNKTIVDLGSVRRAADDIGLGSEVFLWLTHRDKITAKNAELEASSIEYNPSPAVSDPKRREPAPVDKNLSVGAHRDISQWWVFTIINELFDKTIGRFSDYPIVQLIASILLFAASFYFFIVNTGMLNFIFLLR